jgi:hypothetical protein
MTNPALLQQFTRQREREITAQNQSRMNGAGRTGLRERIGWSLVSLGARLALDRQVRSQAQWRQA